ncbi:MAG: toxin-antitoxin system YwqK family antitoxin, partial [Crocinitomicaceae bacterium]
YYEYYRNGQISVRANFVDGLRDGDYTEYYYDGTIWETGRFIKGDYDGEYNTYFANGNLKSKEIYKNGDRIEAAWYNANGEVEFKN